MFHHVLFFDRYHGHDSVLAFDLEAPHPLAVATPTPTATDAYPPVSPVRMQDRQSLNTHNNHMSPNYKKAAREPISEDHLMFCIAVSCNKNILLSRNSILFSLTSKLVRQGPF